MFSTETFFVDELRARWKALDAAIKDADSAFWKSFEGLAEDEKQAFKDTYAAIRDAVEKNITISEPREPAALPAIIVDEKETGETEQYLGAGAEIADDEGRAETTTTTTFRSRKTATFEVFAKNRDTARRMAFLVRYILHAARHEWDSHGDGVPPSFQKQRVQALNASIRQEALFPEEHFARTVIFGFEVDEHVFVVEKVPIINDITTEVSE